MSRAVRALADEPETTTQRGPSKAECAALERARAHLRSLGPICCEYDGQISEHRRRYMNASVPLSADGLNGAGVCCQCGHGYAHLAGTDRVVCDECRLEQTAEHAERVQQECGVNLGWHERDPVSERMIYGFKDPINLGFQAIERTVLPAFGG